jgi:taurine dioxygenase
MAPDESAALLGYLVGHVTSPNFQVRYHWTVGDVAIWDERCTQHFAVADYLPERREMARVAVLDRQITPAAC